jgi:hypothetical protein
VGLSVFHQQAFGKNKPSGVPKRACMLLGFLVIHYFSGDLLDSVLEKIPLTLWPTPLKTLRPKTPTPATMPMTDWNTTLP